MFPETRLVTDETEIDERYTQEATDLWARKQADVVEWDLDVAACEERHLAPLFFTKAHDGLLMPWWGRVWCNPPFSDIEPWVEKAWAEIQLRATVVAMLLPASRTEQRWWQGLVEPYRDRETPTHGALLTTRFLPGRTRFGLPGNPRGDGVGSPPFGCVLLVWRHA